MTTSLTLRGRAAWVLVGLALAAGTPGLAAQQPNVLVIVADDLGVDRVGAYAAHPDPGHTPVIDALATDGVLFTNVWTNPTCSPSRAAMLTGRYTRTTGFSGTGFYGPNSPFELPLAEVLIPEALPAGYGSAAIGKWHLGSQYASGINHPTLQGFDHFRGTMSLLPGFISDAYYSWQKITDGTIGHSDTYNTTDCVDDALELIDGFAGPWFVWLAFHAPHAPFHKPPPALHTFSLPPNVADDIPLHVKAVIEAMDTEIGRLLASMDPAVLAETVIIFIGDNGTDKPATTAPYSPLHAKNTMYEGGVHVPLIVVGPGVAQGGQCSALVNGTDLFATVMELTNSAAPVPADSVSFAPYLAQPGLPSARGTLYAEDYRPNGFGPYLWRKRTVRDDQYKLIERYDDDTFSTEQEFYDLSVDAFELDDLLLGDPLSSAEQLAYDAFVLELAEPYVPWLQMAGGLPGTAGQPLISGVGAVTSSSPLTLSLTQARPDSLSALVVGLQNLSVWFEGGIFVPTPDLIQFYGSDPSGAVVINAVWPPGVPPGESLVFQFWIEDPQAIYGWASTRGLAATFE